MSLLMKSGRRVRCWISCCIILLLCPLTGFAGPQIPGGQISHGRFAKVSMYAPQGAVKQFVLMLSGDDGWNPGMSQMAGALTEKGALVAGIDVPRFFADLAKDGSDCVFPDGDLENLAHYIQAYYRLPTYHTPLLVGYSSGATLAYAMLAQAPAGTFVGALSLGFCTDLELRKPLCKTGSLRYTARKDGNGFDLLPPPKLPAPWIALHGELDRVCSATMAQSFLASVAQAKFVLLRDVGHGYGVKARWLPQYHSAYTQLTQQHVSSLPLPPKDLSGLPIIEVPVKTAGDTLAIILSGDGGWAGLDKEVAAELAQSGIPVAGLDSLRYFWSKRTPAGLAADLDRIIRYYCAHWQRRRVLLIGYSQGADVLPFAVARLPAVTRQTVALTALLGLGEQAHFEFHFSDWVTPGRDGLPIAPEIASLKSGKLLCIYGEDESDSLCPTIASARVRTARLPGGHHFNGNYRHLAKLIIAAAER